ncbi:MAG: MscL family protein [Actinobacteria bacterium]|nr:MscL family protein [Actinomycetota bacterium]
MGERTKGFIEFIRKQGLVGLAIGFIVGGDTGVVVSSLVTNLINPIIGAVVGQGSLDTLTFHIGDEVFDYEYFIGVLINLAIILVMVYLVFKVLRPERLDPGGGRGLTSP